MDKRKSAFCTSPPEPPENYCGVRLVMHRHLIERSPFELLVATNNHYFVAPLPHEGLRLPYPIYRLRRSRFGPLFSKWVTDFENMVWPFTAPRQLDEIVERFRPDVILGLAHNCLCEVSRRVAQRHNLPLAGLFLDWFPIMNGHFGHRWTCNALSRRYRQFYKECDLAFCTSDGMQEVLGTHPNSHVIYPMPGKHRVPVKSSPPSNGKFRLVYVGSVERFYGRMLCSLIEKIEAAGDLEIIVVGPNADWPAEIIQRAKAKGIYLGFKPPEEAAAVLAGADALLVVMSFEKEYELFMRTSFTTKFLDYVAFGKPVILWGPEYCTPFKVAKKHGGAVMVNREDAGCVVAAARELAGNQNRREQLSQEATNLHKICSTRIVFRACSSAK
ncbi:MAG: glycosyltransferase [Limisphaerales bacterium]